MIKIAKYISLIGTTTFFVACVPQPQLQPPIQAESRPQTQSHVGTSIGRPIGISTVGVRHVAEDSEYGAKPKNYVSSIKNYFSLKLPRGDRGKYKFAKPKRAYKRKGLAYGGDVAWRGWLVETSVAIPNRTGRLLTPRPYMVLFSGEQIVEHILGNSHKLLVKVDR